MGESEPGFSEADRTTMDSYDQTYFEGQCKLGGTAFRRYYSFVRSLIVEDDTVLDFGCGLGDLLDKLPCRMKVGVEINPAARNHACQRGLEVKASTDELAGMQFSRIVSTHVLEHLASPADTLMTLREFLDPDGLLILVLPLDDWRSLPQRRWQRNNRHMHLYAWTPNTIGNLLTICGFEPISIKIVNRAHPARMGNKLWEFSPQVYFFAAWMTAVLLLRRQLFVVARTAETK